jgi:drug/metabolite transporter (DMT)-like permease
MLAAASALWSLGGVLIKWVQWHPLAIAGVRSLIAAVTVYALMPRPRFTFSRVQLAAAGCYAATVVLFVCANKLTTAANAIFLQYTAPIYIALLGAWFLRERPSRVDWILMGVTQLGIGLFFLDDLKPGNLAGNLFALASGLCYSVLVVLLRQQKDASPFESVLLGNVLTACIGLPFAFTSPAEAVSVPALLLLGVVQLGIPYVMFASAIRHVRALDASLISAIEPVLNPVWVFLALGERPGAWALVGGSVVIGSAVLRGVITSRAAAGGAR